MAECGTELRTVPSAPNGKPEDGTTILIITETGYFQMSFAQFFAVMNSLYAAKDHNHDLIKLKGIEGTPEDGQILVYDAEDGKVKWVTPNWMPAGSNFDNRYVKLSPDKKVVNGDTSYQIMQNILEKIVVTPTGDLASFSIGSGPGLSDIMAGLPISANDSELFSLNILKSKYQMVWFNGITSETTIEIYLR